MALGNTEAPKQTMTADVVASSMIAVIGDRGEIKSVSLILEPSFKTITGGLYGQANTNGVILAKEG